MDEMMQGLAGQGQQESRTPPTIKEVVMLLMQGTRPEELLAQGVPQEIVEEAMQVISQQMSAQNEPQGPVGLAGMATQGML